MGSQILMPPQGGIYTCDNNKITDDFVIIINKNKYVVKLPGIGECE